MNDYGPRYTNADERERTQHDPYAEDLAQCHHALWEFRKRAAAWWPTPDRDDALRFAVTEAGEALDAWLRANRPQYARNRDRLNGEDAVLNELTDCVMMLMSTDPDIPSDEWMWLEWDTTWTIDNVWFNTTKMAYWTIEGYSSAVDIDPVSYTCRGIQSYPGMFPILPRLKARLARIENKHKPKSIWSESWDTSADPAGVWMSEADDG